MSKHTDTNTEGFSPTVVSVHLSYSASVVPTPVLKEAWHATHRTGQLLFSPIALEQVKHYLKEWAMEQLLATSHNRVLVFKLPLQSFWKAFHQSSKSTACKALKTQYNCNLFHESKMWGCWVFCLVFLSQMFYYIGTILPKKKVYGIFK